MRTVWMSSGRESESRFTPADAIEQRVFREVVTDTDAAGGKTEPVCKNAPTVVFRIESQQSVQPVLLLAPASIPTEHLIELERTLLPVDVLLEGVNIE